MRCCPHAELLARGQLRRLLTGLLEGEDDSVLAALGADLSAGAARTASAELQAAIAVTRSSKARGTAELLHGHALLVQLCCARTSSAACEGNPRHTHATCLMPTLLLAVHSFGYQPEPGSSCPQNTQPEADAQTLAMELLAESRDSGPACVHMERALETLAAALWPKLQAERLLVMELGGLHVIGTERHDSRRVDNQVRCFR